MQPGYVKNTKHKERSGKFFSSEDVVGLLHLKKTILLGYQDSLVHDGLRLGPQNLQKPGHHIVCL